LACEDRGRERPEGALRDVGAGDPARFYRVMRPSLRWRVLDATQALSPIAPGMLVVVEIATSEESHAHPSLL
jgi:hypothetical protein